MDASNTSSSPSTAASLPRQLSRKVLLLLVLVLVFLQYLNLLQSKEGPRRRLHGRSSLFTLHWGGPAASAAADDGRGGRSRRRPLLTSLEGYLKQRAERRMAEEGGGANASLLFFSYDDLNLFPDIVAPSAPIVVEDTGLVENFEREFKSLL